MRIAAHWLFGSSEQRAARLPVGIRLHILSKLHCYERFRRAIPQLGFSSARQPQGQSVNRTALNRYRGGSPLISQSPTFPSRAIPLSAILLICLAVHGPLLLMQLPASSYDANTHMFFAAHYAHHWFNPWNAKWFGGFSQTTYPPLTHQWIALFSHIMGLTEGFMLVQLAAVVLLAVGAYRFAQLWVDDRAASYAGVLAVFAGSIAFLVYSAGQLPTTMSAPLYFLSLPYLYSWCRSASWRALLKGIALTLAAASAHHVTLIFGSVLFALPVLWLAWYDARN